MSKPLLRIKTTLFFLPWVDEASPNAKTASEGGPVFVHLKAANGDGVVWAETTADAGKKLFSVKDSYCCKSRSIKLFLSFDTSFMLW